MKKKKIILVIGGHDPTGGAGIVADSKPIKEYEETVNKAKALINALR